MCVHARARGRELKMANVRGKATISCLRVTSENEGRSN